MPYTVVTGDILEVAIKARQADQRVMNTFHYRLISDGGPLDGIGAINAFNPLFNGGAGTMLGEWVKTVNTGVTVEEISYQWVHAIRRARVSKLPSLLVGIVAGTKSPPNLAATLTKRSDLAGRRGLGTVHMPGLVNENWAEGRFTPGGLDTYGTLLSLLFAAVVVDFGITYQPVIFNRETPSDSPPVTNSNAQQTVRTMHRRTVGVGE